MRYHSGDTGDKCRAAIKIKYRKKLVVGRKYMGRKGVPLIRREAEIRIGYNDF